MSAEAPASRSPVSARAPLTWLGAALLIIPVNFGVWALAADNRSLSGPLMVVFGALAFAQLGCGLAALVTGLKTARALRAAGSSDTAAILAAIVGVLAALGAVGGGFLGWVSMKIP